MGYLHAAISLVNLLLLGLIVYYFFSTYREVRSKFSMGLLFFSAVLFLNGFFILPMFYEMLAPVHACPYEPYYTIAGGFELIALLILLTLIRK